MDRLDTYLKEGDKLVTIKREESVITNGDSSPYTQMRIKRLITLFCVLCLPFPFLPCVHTTTEHVIHEIPRQALMDKVTKQEIYFLLCVCGGGGGGFFLYLSV